MSKYRIMRNPAGWFRIEVYVERKHWTWPIFGPNGFWKEVSGNNGQTRWAKRVHAQAVVDYKIKKRLKIDGPWTETESPEKEI